MNTATNTAPVAPTYAPAPAPAFTPAQEYGKAAAADYPLFRAYYGIVKSDRGVTITGPSPDGRYTGTCDRCGIAISHVYVFTDKALTRYMHVGVDCAQRMGVPVDELRKARAFATEVGRMRDRAARAATREAAAKVAREEEAAERAHNRAVHGALLAELDGLAADENATDWERRRIATAIGLVESCGDALTPVVVTLDSGVVRDDRYSYHIEVARDVETIRDRLSLCRTSKVSEAATILAAVREVAGWSTEGKAAVKAAREGLAAGVKGRAGKGLSQAEKDAARGVLTLTLEVWRDAMALDGGSYGGHSVERFRNYFRDDAGNAYSYVGSKATSRGDRVTATWTVNGTDTYAGLTATRLARPRNATRARLYGIGDCLPLPTPELGEDGYPVFVAGAPTESPYLAAPALGPAEAW